MPDAVDIMGTLAAHLGTAMQIDELHTYPLFTYNPTPPAIDMYPADPFYVETVYGQMDPEFAFTVRARVNGDHEEQQKALIRMMDPTATGSLQAGLNTASITGVDYIHAEPPTEFQVFPDPSGTGEGLLGTTWRVRIGL